MRKSLNPEASWKAAGWIVGQELSEQLTLVGLMQAGRRPSGRNDPREHAVRWEQTWRGRGRERGSDFGALLGYQGQFLKLGPRLCLFSSLNRQLIFL